MVQVKKPEMRSRILSAAAELFATNGYTRATINEIARASGTAPSNVYVYFKSKLEIVFALYEPWFREQIETLGIEVAQLRSSEAKILRIIHKLWSELPADSRSNNVIQAVAAAMPGDRYDPGLLRWTEQKVADMLASALPADRAAELDCLRLAHVLMMAFDGFAVNYRTARGVACNHGIVRQMGQLITGAASSSTAPAKKSQREMARRKLRVAGG